MPTCHARQAPGLSVKGRSVCGERVHFFGACSGCTRNRGCQPEQCVAPVCPLLGALSAPSLATRCCPPNCCVQYHRDARPRSLVPCGAGADRGVPQCVPWQPAAVAGSRRVPHTCAVVRLQSTANCPAVYEKQFDLLFCNLHIPIQKSTLYELSSLWAQVAAWPRQRTSATGHGSVSTGPSVALALAAKVWCIARHVGYKRH